MSIIVQILVALASMYIAEVTRKLPDPPKTPGLEDFQAPTVDASRKYPVFWGRPVLKGPNLTWMGELWARPIQKKIKGLFTSDKQTIGHQIHIGLHFCFGYSRNPAHTRLLKLFVQETEVWSGSLTDGLGEIAKPNIFGGDESEGGLWGAFTFCPGGPNQAQDHYLVRPSAIGPKVPAYRSSIRLVWHGGHYGNSKYLKELSAQIQSLPALLNSGFHDIDGEANGAEILYELLVHPLFGLNESPLNIEISTFLSCASRLHSEGLGLSLVWDGSRPMSEIVREVERHIDGAVFRNVQTGKWEMALNRRLTSDQIAALPMFHRGNCEITSFSRPSQDELVNELYVNWTQQGETSKVPVRASNLATLGYQQNQVVPKTVTYAGITKFQLADKLAWRDLATFGMPLDRITARLNREGYVLKPLSKFRLEWDDSLPQLADCYVVTDIQYGTLEDPAITIEAVQDSFDLGPNLNIGGTGNETPPIDRDPLIPENAIMMFTPYWLLDIQEGVANPESTQPMLLVEAPSLSHLDYLVKYTDPLLNTTFAEAESSQPFTPTAELVFDLTPTNYSMSASGILHVSNLYGLTEPPKPATLEDLRSLGTGLILINNEFMGIRNTVNKGNGIWLLQVERALLDTPMAPIHRAGSKVWFVSAGIGRTPSLFNPWQTGSYSAKALPVTVAGPLEEAQAPTMTITSANLSDNVRPLWSYPVRNLGIFGSTTGTTVAVNNTSLPVTWRHPNRAQEHKIRLHNDTTYVPVGGVATGFTIESDVTYKVYLYDENDVLMATSPVLTDTSYTFDLNAIYGQRIPQRGYVQVEAIRPVYGAGARATVWFTLSVALQGIPDGAAQETLDAYLPTSFWRLND